MIPLIYLAISCILIFDAQWYNMDINFKSLLEVPLYMDSSYIKISYFNNNIWNFTDNSVHFDIVEIHKILKSNILY